MEETIKEGKISVTTLVVRLIFDALFSVLLIGIYWAARDIGCYLTTKITLTNKRVRGKVGTHSIDSPLDKINAVSVDQGFLGSIFHYGTISVTTASAEPIKFYHIEKPNELKAAINDEMEKYEEEKLEKQAKKMAEAMK